MNKDNYVIKQASVNIDDISEKGILSGYANVYNIEDTDGDISQVGSFTKTVTENRKRIKILKNHDKNQFIGVPSELDANDPYGLKLSAKLQMNKPIAKEVYEDSRFLLDNGFESGFSIGGWVLKRSKSNTQIVTEYKLNEISVLIGYDPANQLSLIDVAKAIKEKSEITQTQFWKIITKAYDNARFSDEILKSLEKFLSLESVEPTTEVTQPIEPIAIVTDIYKQFIL